MHDITDIYYLGRHNSYKKRIMTNITLSEIKLRMDSYDRTHAARNKFYQSGNEKLIHGLLDEVAENEYIEIWYQHDHYYSYIDNHNQWRPHAKVDEQLKEIKRLNPSYFTPSDYSRPHVCPMESTGLTLATARSVMRMGLQDNLQLQFYLELMDNYRILQKYLSVIGSGHTRPTLMAVTDLNQDHETCSIAYLTVPEHIAMAAVKFEALFNLLEQTHRVQLLDEHDLQKVSINALCKYTNGKQGVVDIKVKGVRIIGSANYILFK